MAQEKKKNFLKLPLYPGGAQALKSFVGNHLQYPEEALKNNISGRVHVSYEVDDNGRVVESHVEKGLGYGCDEEALRIVNMLAYEKVRNQGRRVKARMRIAIHFNLPPTEPFVKNETGAEGLPDSTINYNYVPKDTQMPKGSEAPPIVYTYTITQTNPHNETPAD